MFKIGETIKVIKKFTCDRYIFSVGDIGVIKKKQNQSYFIDWKSADSIRRHHSADYMEYTAFHTGRGSSDIIPTNTGYWTNFNTININTRIGKVNWKARLTTGEKK